MTSSTTPTAARSSTITLWALRTMAVFAALSVLYQAFSASAVIVAGDAALDAHETGAVVLHVFTGLLAVAAAAQWRATRGPVWPAVLAVVLFAATFLEASLGHKRTLWAHVPLAMLIVGATTTILVWVFWRRPGNV